MTPLLLALVLAQQPLPPGATPPPNHPPMGGQQLPPNHPPTSAMPQGQAPTSEELLQRLDQAQGLKDKDKPFEVAVSLGRLYFSHGRYAESVVFFEQAVAKADEGRKLFLDAKKALGKTPMPAPATVGCAPEGEPNLEKQLALAKGKKKAPELAACARAALHPLIEVEAQLASAKFLTGDKAGALKVHDRALELFPSNAEARYGRAAILLDTRGDDLEALKAAKADLDKFLEDYPTSTHARQAKQFQSRVNEAIAAGGITRLAAQPPKKRVDPMEGLPTDHPRVTNERPPPLTPEVMEALKKIDVSPEMVEGFDATISAAEDQLAAGKYQDALNSYKQVMPFQPENGRVRAGMAWSLVKLGRQPMADNIWGVAAGDPAAIDALGDALAKKGNAADAKGVWTKLKDTVPAYAPKLEAKLK
jgi:tetratricopeptide (TPR) repeat protein